MKLCFSTLGCSDMSLEEILALCADYRISALEIRGIGGVLDNSKIQAFAKESIGVTSEAFRASGVAPKVLGTSCSFHNAERFDKSVGEGLAAIELAEKLGIPYIRVFGDKILSDDELGCTERVISGLKTLCAAAKNTSVLLEIHGNFNTVTTLSPILNELHDTKNFGLIWDIEHTHGSYGENWLDFYEIVRPFVKHVHIKDRSDAEDRLVLVGKGDIPIIPIVKRLLSDGYDGCLSLEWEKKWHPELPDIRTALDSFIKTMNEVRT